MYHVEAYVNLRFKKMLQEVEGSLSLDSESYKQQWYNELLDTRKKVQKQVTDVGQKWVEYLEEGKKEVKAEIAKAKPHPSSAALEMFKLEETLAKAQDYDNLNRLQRMGEMEEREKLYWFKKKQEFSEKRRIAYLNSQIQTSFAAQRDRLYSKVRQVACENAEKELKIERRIQVVVQRLKIEQSREIAVVRRIFQEHCSRIEHFVAGAGGKKSEAFTPFAALEIQTSDEEDEEAKEKKKKVLFYLV